MDIFNEAFIVALGVCCGVFVFTTSISFLILTVMAIGKLIEMTIEYLSVRS